MVEMNHQHNPEPVSVCVSKCATNSGIYGPKYLMSVSVVIANGPEGRNRLLLSHSPALAIGLTWISRPRTGGNHAHKGKLHVGVRGMRA